MLFGHQRFLNKDFRVSAWAFLDPDFILKIRFWSSLLEDSLVSVLAKSYNFKQWIVNYF